MISYGIVIFFLLGLKVGAVEDELSSFEMVNANELGTVGMETWAEDYDMSDEMEEAEELAADFLEKSAPPYVYKFGEKNVGVVKCFGKRLCFYISNEPDEPFRYCVRWQKNRCTYSFIPQPRFYPFKCRFNRYGRIYTKLCVKCNRYGGCMTTFHRCQGLKTVNGVKVCNFKRCHKRCWNNFNARSCRTDCF